MYQQIRSPKRSHTLSLLDTASEAPNCRAMTSCSEKQINASNSEIQSSIGCYDFSEEKISHTDISHSEDQKEQSQSRIPYNIYNKSNVLRNMSTLTNEQQGTYKRLEEQSRYYFASNTSNNAGSECEQEHEYTKLDNRQITHKRIQNQGQIGISNFLNHPESGYFEEQSSQVHNEKDLLNQNLNNLENNNSYNMTKTHSEKNKNGKRACDIVTTAADDDEMISSHEMDDICTDSPSSSSSSSGEKQDEFIVKVPEVKLEKFELDKQALLQSMEVLLKNYQNTSKESLKIQNSQQQSLEKASILQMEQLNEIKVLKKKLTLKTAQLESLYDWKKKTRLELKKYKQVRQMVNAENHFISPRTEKLGEIHENSQSLSDIANKQGFNQELKKIVCCEQCNEVKLKRLELEEEIKNVYHDQFQIEEDLQEIIQFKDEAIANLQIQVKQLTNDLEIKREQSNELLNEININNSRKAQQVIKNSEENKINKCQDNDKQLCVIDKIVVVDLLAQQLIIYQQLLEYLQNQGKEDNLKDIDKDSCEYQGIQQGQTSIQVQFIDQLILNNQKIQDIIESYDFVKKVVEEQQQQQSREIQISEQHLNYLELNICLQQKLNEVINALDQQKQADAEIIRTKDYTIETLMHEQRELFTRIDKLTDENTQIKLICSQKSDGISILQSALKEKSIENERLVTQIDEINQKGLVDDSKRINEFEEGLRIIKEEGLIKEQRLNIEIQELVQLNEKYQYNIDDLNKEIELLKKDQKKRISLNEEIKKEYEIKISKLSQQNQLLEGIQGDLKAQIVELLKSEDQKRQDTLEKENVWAKEKLNYQQQIIRLEEQIKQSIELLNDTREMNKMQITENEFLKKEIMKIKEEQKENQQKYVNATEKLALENKTLERKVIELSQENNRLKEINQKLILESKQLSETKKQSERQLQEVNSLLKIQSEKISNLLTQISEQNTKLQALKEINENNNVQIMQGNYQVNDLQAQVLDLKKKLEIKDQVKKEESSESNDMFQFKQAIMEQLLENRSILARSIFENISYFMREIHDFIQAKPTKFLVKSYQHIFESLQQQAEMLNNSTLINSNGTFSCPDSTKVSQNIQSSRFHLQSQLDIPEFYLNIPDILGSMLQTVLSLYYEINRQIIQTID